MHISLDAVGDLSSGQKSNGSTIVSFGRPVNVEEDEYDANFDALARRYGWLATHRIVTGIDTS